jgi:hypothetical protein
VTPTPRTGSRRPSCAATPSWSPRSSSSSGATGTCAQNSPPGGASRGSAPMGSDRSASVTDRRRGRE